MTQSIMQLAELLDEWNIPYELTDDVCGNENNQLWYPNCKHNICDVICHEYSYGGKDGLLEMMGLVPEEVDDDVEGYLTVAEVFHRIMQDYCENKVKN